MSSAEAAAAADAEEEERQRRQRKLEEVLEVKSLRRIISAYLNYSDAAEDDVRRYERSFRKLQPAHKALLSHLALKFQKLRRCISLNSFFILNMLQAFDPPLDMSQDTDIRDYENEKNAHDDHIQLEASHCKEMKFGSEHHSSTSGRTASRKHKERSCEEEKNIISTPPGRTGTEEVQMKSFCESVTGSCSVSSETCVAKGSNDVKAVTDEYRHSSVSNANGYVTSQSPDWLDPSLRLNVPLVDVDKVRCIIRNIVRDWAPEGRRERDACYKPILEELDRLFPARCKSRPPSCLVPGAGLGRLALDISCLGFISQDNDQLRPVKFPDIHPASAGITEGFSMCGGDFVEVYSDPSQYGAWDAVVTCFFLDTAHNIVEYIEVISRILKDGGVWINLGPLLYHFADAYGPEDEMSIELSLEDVKKVAFQYGFEMEMGKTIETTYTANLQSMMQTHYFAAFWTMKKV